ncbi:hypothetical protein RL72_00912 [Microbacterium azadirachtae]|uniref:Uncharacterized protein n=1 Tax=Microbacterium azadirachtae TaxID=582680 RepID=A0A0F0L0R6_9MICO|nr:hypothetical protein RL72_00912 [Microbacterium azadirachtae]
MSIGVTECDSSICTFCSARAKATALPKRSSWFFAMPRSSTRVRLSGTSARPSGGSGSLSIREIRSAPLLRCPGFSNGLRPVSSV